MKNAIENTASKGSMLTMGPRSMVSTVMSHEYSGSENSSFSTVVFDDNPHYNVPPVVDAIIETIDQQI